MRLRFCICATLMILAFSACNHSTSIQPPTATESYQDYRLSNADHPNPLPVSNPSTSCLPGLQPFLSIQPGWPRARVIALVGIDHGYFTEIKADQTGVESTLYYYPPSKTGGVDKFGSIQISFATTANPPEDAVSEVLIIANGGVIVNSQVTTAVC